MLLCISVMVVNGVIVLAQPKCQCFMSVACVVSVYFKMDIMLKKNIMKILLVGMIGFFLPVMGAAATESLYHLSRIGLTTIEGDGASNQQFAGVVLGLRVANAYYVEAEINLPVRKGKYYRNGVPRYYKDF